MTRVAYAAKKLLEQVGCRDHPACGVVGDPDGFGVHRTVMVPAQHADVLVDDPRVRAVEVVTSDLGQVALVTVVSGRLGDTTQAFALGH